MKAMCCVLGQNTLHSQSFDLCRSIHGWRLIVRRQTQKGPGVSLTILPKRFGDLYSLVTLWMDTEVNWTDEPAGLERQTYNLLT